MDILDYCLLKEHRDAGLTLEVDREDRVHLKQAGRLVKTWDDGPAAIVLEIRRVAEAALGACPIGLDKAHCPSCAFQKEALCDWPYSAINERK